MSIAVAVLGPVQRPYPSFAPPSFVFTRDFFAKITQISHFFAFPNCGKWANLRLPLNVQKPKVLQLQGASPLVPDQGLCPWTPLGVLPQTPVIGSRYRARYKAVPPRYCGLEPPLVLPQCL